MQNTYPLWVSHSSISDFLNCPRAYFLRHIYKDPKTKRKITVINPSLTLGTIVHEVLESLSLLPAEKRFQISLIPLYESLWEHVLGRNGGFKTIEQEEECKERGKRMIQKVMKFPGPLLHKAVRLHSPDDLPRRFLLSQPENIILCGKIDWLEYLAENDSVHIIDFKTGVRDENPNSLQLPIYCLLVKNCQKRQVEKISYWYLETNETPTSMPLPDLDIAEKQILSVAVQMKKLREKGEYTCIKSGGCFACKPLEAVLSGKATFIRTSGYQDIYALL